MQITLDLGSEEENRPTLTLELEQRIIALMAQIIVAVVQSQRGEDHEPE